VIHSNKVFRTVANPAPTGILIVFGVATTFFLAGTFYRTALIRFFRIFGAVTALLGGRKVLLIRMQFGFGFD